MRPRRHPLAVAATAALATFAALLALGATGRAVAAPGYQQARFIVQIEGVQTTSWEHHHISEGGCDVPIDGSGEETFRFRSAPLRVTAIRTPSGVLLTSGGRAATLKLRGTLTRTGTILVGAGEICSEGDGTGGPAPNPPDCGTRKVRGEVEVGFMIRPKDLVGISDDVGTSLQPFQNCPTGSSDQYPQVMAFGDNGKRVGRRLPASDLFRHGKNIVIARGSKTVRVPETTAHTDVRWTLSFTRIGKTGGRP